MKRIVVGLLTTSFLVAACGGGGSAKPNAYQLAQHACNTSGQQAADLARQAAALDPKYDQLAADEIALAGNLNAQQSGSSDQNLAGVTAESGTGPGSSYQVLLDCKNVALSVLPGQ